MGRVFTEEQVKANDVPTPEDFTAAVDAFKEAAIEGRRAGLIDGAVIFGSVAIVAATIRSDLDCMIIPVDHSPEALAAVQAVAYRVYDYTMGRVPVNATIHHRARLASGEHEIDRFFGAHLTSPKRLVLDNDPARYIRFGDEPARQLLLAYIRHKKRGLGNLIPEIQPAAHAAGLQRLLELPTSLGRKALMVVDEVEGTHLATTNSAKKELITEPFLALLSDMGIDHMARQILEYDQYYNDELAEALKTGNIHGYTSFLEELDDLAIQASSWLDDLDQAFGRRLPKDY